MLNVIGNLIGAGSNAIFRNFFLGSPGTAFNAAGSHNVIDFSSAVTLTGAFTVSFWGWVIDQSGANSNHSICGNQSDFAQGRLCFSTNYLRVDTTAASNQQISIASVNIEDTMKFIEIKRAASTNVITLYLNKVAVGTVTVAGNLVINRVMGSPVNSGWLGWTGGMRNFKIYSKELSTEESNTNYSGYHVSDSCQLWYEMDEKSGTTMIDKSGNARNGTLANHDAATFFQSVKSTTNLLTNGGFTLWTGTAPDEYPNNFTRATYVAGVTYLQNVSGKMRVVSTDGSLSGIAKTIYTTGKNYKFLGYATAQVSTGYYIYDGVNGASAGNSAQTTGWFVFDFKAMGPSFGLYRRGGVCDITVANIQLMER